jgi:hypothetical protein
VRELLRMAGSPDNLFMVSVQPWTLTAALYPRARWTVVRDADKVSLSAVSRPHKSAAAGALVGLCIAAMWPPCDGPG